MMSKNNLLAAVVVVTPLLLAAGAYAHGGGKPEHGGVLQMVGETSLELVVKPDHVELYVEDEGEEMPSADRTAKLTVTSAGKSVETMLQPAGGNKFDAAGLTIPKGAKAAVQVTTKATQAQVGTTFVIN